jgi:hypothetical protein
MQQSVTFDTEVDDAGAVALAVAYAYGYDSIEELVETTIDDDTEGAVGEADTVPNGSTYPGGWSTPKMRRYIKALKPTAQKVLRAIAESAPNADVQVVQDASGIHGYQYAGSMSSFGFAARNTHGVKTKPFEKVGSTYEMDPQLAKLTLAVLGELGI